MPDIRHGEGLFTCQTKLPTILTHEHLTQQLLRPQLEPAMCIRHVLNLENENFEISLVLHQCCE